MQPPDIQRLIQIIIEELAAAGHRAPATERCACHSVLSECCPDRLRGILDAGATRLGLHAAGGATGGVAAMIDHTLLKPDATRQEIETLCREAAQYEFASVCVNPTWVAVCARALQGSRVKVCSVVGFPLGATTADTKHFETRRAIFDGACEIDMVINVGALRSGDHELVRREIEKVSDACHEAGAINKVIIEAAFLTDEEKVIASHVTKLGRADFVKTSTGFGPGGATLEDVLLMRETVGPKLGVKAAGGIRSAEDVREMIAAGATRIGASASVAIVSGGDPGDGRY